MNVISRPAINAAISNHADAKNWLNAWWKVSKSARWTSLWEVRLVYPAADQVGGCLVFNACGNKYRLIVGVAYADDSKGGTLFVKHFLTHAQYNQETWKDDC